MNLFEPFQRSYNNNLNPNGVGLGLNICKKIVEELGGSICVMSQPNGAKFSFVIKVWSYEDLATELRIRPEDMN